MKKRKVNSFETIRSILSGTWFIDKQYIVSAVPLIKRILSGTGADEDFEITHTRCKLVTPSGKVLSMEDDDYEDDESPGIETFKEVDEPGSIAIIPLQGAIVKHDTWCEVGTKTRAEQLKSAKENPNIIGTILLVDTPGGESFACELMDDAVQDYKTSGKPIITFVDGMMCSAGVYCASGTDETVLSGKSSWVGSIGTMWSFVDIRGWKEFEGVIFHEVYASKSKDKNKDYREAMDNNNYQPMVTEILDPMNEQFIQTVKRNRPSVKGTALTGKVFIGDDIISQGLADRFGTLNSIINQIKMKGKLNSLSQYANKQLTKEEGEQVMAILKESGIELPPAQEETNTDVTSQLFEQKEGKGIYVYAEEGEDPVGKRCVYADEAGNPTEEVVEAGDHELADGRVMTTSVKEEDGLSYVDSISESAETTETEEAPATAKAIVSALMPLVKAEIKKEIKGLRKELVPGQGIKTPKAINSAGKPVFTKSPFQKRREEIQTKYKNRKLS